MGVCQSDVNLIDQIDQHQHEKGLKGTRTEAVEQTETASIASTADEININELKSVASSVPSTSSIRSSSDNIDRMKKQRKASLQRKINILSFASQKIEQYKTENHELKEVNAELNEMNGELKEYIDDKNESLLRKDHDIRELELKVLKLEQQMIDNDSGNSINDILYKIQGDTVHKLKYNKMSAKRVIFINGINHLFYYDETECRDAKCMIIRDILVASDAISKVVSIRDKAWFLMIGAKRSALFIAESISTRDKWFTFVKRSLNAKELTVSNSLNMNLIESISMMNTLTIDRLQLDRMSNLSEIDALLHHPNIITSPRSGNTRIMIDRNEEFEYKSLSINYPCAVSNCTILNNGHTVQINIHCDVQCTLSMNDGNLYRLKEFHFHVPSEHTIVNKQFEMELHLVHHNTTDHKDILVLCFIFTTKQKYKAPKLLLNPSKTHLIRSNTPSKTNINETDDDDTDDEWSQHNDENRNDFLDQFWNQMPQYKTKHDIPLNKPLNFDFLFKNAANNFIKNIKTNDININVPIYDYVGSLRTPPYTKGVKWLISKKTHFINYKQLNRAKKIWYHYL